MNTCITRILFISFGILFISGKATLPGCDKEVEYDKLGMVKKCSELCDYNNKFYKNNLCNKNCTKCFSSMRDAQNAKEAERKNETIGKQCVNIAWVVAGSILGSLLVVVLVFVIVVISVLHNFKGPRDWLIKYLQGIKPRTSKKGTEDTGGIQALGETGENQAAHDREANAATAEEVEIEEPKPREPLINTGPSAPNTTTA